MLRMAALVLVGLLSANRGGAPRVLFLTHSAGFVHDVVKRPAPDRLAAAEEALLQAARGRFEVVATQDCGEVTAEKLKGYSAVVFYTSGELPIDAAALLDYVRGGGGFVGIHCATDTLYKNAAYGEMIGGYFDGHPWHQQVRVRVEDRRHPATAHLGASFEIKDEIYQFRSWDRKKVRVLLSLDPESVKISRGKREDRDYALAWTSRYGRGRVFYSALGHRPEVWRDARFLTHVVEGALWSMGRREPADAEGFEPLSFDEGWVQAGPGKFAVEDGVATPSGGMGLWYREGRSFKNFILKLEYAPQRIDANSGVFVRFPRVDGDPWHPVREGYEIQIAGDRPSKTTTGAVYSFKKAEEIPLRPAGEWNDYEISCLGQNYYVRLNGRLINTFEGKRSRAGMIGLQNHDDKSVVRFRRVRVRELPDDAERCSFGPPEGPLEDFILLAQYKGAPQVRIRGEVRLEVPASDDWADLELAVAGNRATVSVRGQRESEATGDWPARGAVTLDGAEFRDVRVVTFASTEY
jgi:type 1 glutamine amidotransferase